MSGAVSPQFRYTVQPVKTKQNIASVNRVCEHWEHMTKHTEDEVREMLREKMEASGLSLRKFAMQVLAVTPSYLSEVFRGTRRPGENILEYLGLERRKVVEIYYLPKAAKRKKPQKAV